MDKKAAHRNGLFGPYTKVVPPAGHYHEESNLEDEHMVYEDFEEREHGLDRSAELYDEGVYDSTTFGERLDPAADDAAVDDMMVDDVIADDAMTAGTPSDDIIQSPITGAATPASTVEDGFGETITSNPHIEDQLADSQLNREAEADYKNGGENATDKNDESLIDKAKDKLKEITGNDKA